jgi:uncharacterized linocin/CFP29 family protein
MTQNNPQVPWTDEQWARVDQVIQEEASRARVAATFLPLYGPLPPDTDFVRANRIGYSTETLPPPEQRITIDDKTIIPLATLQVKVFLRSAQLADPDLTSALQMFRRAANILARLEDAVVFNGQSGEDQGPPRGAPQQAIWKITGGSNNGGVLGNNPQFGQGINGNELVAAVSSKIGELEGNGYFGPFAVVLDQKFFTAAQTPNAGSLVLPQDRIIPFLGGGPLLRSSTLPENSGVVIALGGEPIELVVAKDVSVGFLHVTEDPKFVFRVYEKIALRVKESGAAGMLVVPPGAPANAPAPKSKK